MSKAVHLRFSYVCLIIVCCKYVSCNGDEPIWHSYQFGTGHGNREELIITGVISDENFNLGKDVTCWKSISAGTRNYAVGLMATAVTTVIAELNSDKEGFAISANVTELNHTLTNLELFEHWNEDSGKTEIILVIASSGSNPELLWFKLNEHHLEHIWTWHVHKNISHLRYFKLEDDKYRLLMLNEVKHNSTADIYEFTLHSSGHNFWLSQTVGLSSSANNSALNFYGPDAYLSIPQKDLNTVLVYKYTKNHFQLYQNLSSHSVVAVTSFKIGFKSFLAVGGASAGIYKFTKHEIIPEKIDGLNLNEADFWLAFPAKTYRDEVMLILQRSVYHGTHKSFFLEVVLYDGAKFVAHEEIACSFYGEVEHGLSCLLDAEGDGGLSGAAVLSLGSALGILVPHKETSGLFMIHTAMKKLKSPVELEVEKLLETRKKLQGMITEQQTRIEAIQKRLQHSIKLNEPNVISAPWKLKSLSTPVFQEKSEEKAHPRVANLQAEPVSIQELRQQAANIRATLDSAKAKLKDAVPLNRQEHHFKELVVDGVIQARLGTSFKSVIIEKLNDEPVPDVFDDLVRKTSIDKPIGGHKTFTDLHVENLTFETINRVPAEKVVLDLSKPIIVHENLVFEHPLEVKGNVLASTGVNSYNLAEEIVEIDKEYQEPMHFENLRVAERVKVAQVNNIPIYTQFDFGTNTLDNVEADEVRIAGNVGVENINGEHFDDFKQSLCFTTVETHIPGETIIAGDLTVDAFETTTLNDLRFPEDYILQSSDQDFSIITANKVFQGPVTAREITTSGTVNGLNPWHFVTLTRNQSLNGSYIFNDLEVIENLNVDNAITGPHFDGFLPNPIITESSEIKANVIFKDLEVAGSITILNDFNGANFEETLKDVVYMDEEDVLITSIKDFPVGFSVLNGLNIVSNTINNVQLNSLITTNTEQTLLLQTLNGPVSFENLALVGLYGNINITKLDEEVVKLTGEQFVSSTITFNNNNDEVPDMLATGCEIVGTLNGLTSVDYLYTTGDRVFKNILVMDKIEVENVLIQGDLTGPIADFSLDDFDARRLSLSREQIVTAAYTINTLNVDNLRADFVNAEAFEKFSFQHYTDTISEMLFEGKLSIGNIHVNGSVSAEYINGQNVKNLKKNCIWKDRDNNFDFAVVQGNVIFNNLNLKNFNNVDFKFFTDGIIYKTETNPVINSFKTFVNGFHVTRIINSERLNSIHVDDILTKTGPQQLAGPLNIYGNVLIHFDSEIYGNLNDVPLEYLIKTFKFVNSTCIVNDDLFFDRLAYIDSLTVNGFANEKYLEDFLKSIVYKSDNTKLLGKMTFEKPVHINQNFLIKEHLNDIDFSEFVQEMVFVTTDDFVEGSVVFTEPVYIEEELIVESDLNTRYLAGIDLDSWNENAVFINHGLIPGKLMFESVTLHGDISINRVNDLDLGTLIPLRSDQHINQSLEFGAIRPFHDIPVGNYVNNLKLIEEYQNSLLMIDTPQDLRSSVAFQGNVLIHDNLEIFGLVNEKNLSTVVTTNTDQNLTTTYIFNSRINIDGSLILSGLINGINVSAWKQRSVRTDVPQIIYNNWNVAGNVTFGKDVGGGGLVQGLNIQNMADQVEEKRLLKLSTESGLIEDYMYMCSNVNEIMTRAQNQIYLFKYLENLQVMEFYNDVGQVHFFKYQNRNYLLVAERDLCTSHLLVWFKSQFQRIKEIKMGRIAQIISVYDGDLLFLVSRSDDVSSDCEVDGTNVWRFDSDDLNRLYRLEDHKVLQESLAPGTFYALINNFVVEYKIVTIVESNIRTYRKWIIDSENLAFVPRGLGTGLALTNGYELFRMIREDPVVEDEFGYETDSYIVGNVAKEPNFVLPGYNGGDVLVMNVGADGKKRSLVAVAHHEETSVKGKLDFIKIYENVITGKVFHKVAAYKPSSLMSLEFGDTGETLLIFLEAGKTLQVYEYKGIEGFKHRTSVKLEGSKLVTMSLPLELNKIERSVIGVVNKNKINFIQAVMMGNRMNEDRPICEL